jgi:hypothetical protein
MNTESPRGGTGLMLVISTATILVIAAECFFISMASYWLLAAVLLLIVAMVCVVIAAVLHTIDGGPVIARTAPAPQPRERAAAQPARHVAIGH